MEQIRMDTPHTALIKLIEMGLTDDISVLRSTATMIYNSEVREIGESTIVDWMELGAAKQSSIVNNHPVFTACSAEVQPRLRELLCRC